MENWLDDPFLDEFQESQKKVKVSNKLLTYGRLMKK